MKFLFEPFALKSELSEYLTSNEQFLLLFNEASIESIHDSLNILIEYYDSIGEEGAVRELGYMMSRNHFNFFGFYFNRLDENSTVNDVRFRRPLMLYSEDFVESLVGRVSKILYL